MLHPFSGSIWPNVVLLASYGAECKAMIALRQTFRFVKLSANVPPSIADFKGREQSIAKGDTLKESTDNTRNGWQNIKYQINKPV